MSTKILIELIIDGDASDAHHVVDMILDAGLLQDAINEHDCDDAGPLHVTNAIVIDSETPARMSTCGKCGNEYPCDEKGNGDCAACYDP